MPIVPTYEERGIGTNVPSMNVSPERYSRVAEAFTKFVPEMAHTIGSVIEKRGEIEAQNFADDNKIKYEMEKYKRLQDMELNTTEDGVVTDEYGNKRYITEVFREWDTNYRQDVAGRAPTKEAADLYRKTVDDYSLKGNLEAYELETRSKLNYADNSIMKKANEYGTFLIQKAYSSRKPMEASDAATDSAVSIEASIDNMVRSQTISPAQGSKLKLKAFGHYASDSIESMIDARKYADALATLDFDPKDLNNEALLRKNGFQDKASFFKFLEKNNAGQMVQTYQMQEIAVDDDKNIPKKLHSLGEKLSPNERKRLTEELLNSMRMKRENRSAEIFQMVDNGKKALAVNRAFNSHTAKEPKKDLDKLANDVIKEVRDADPSDIPNFKKAETIADVVFNQILGYNKKNLGKKLLNDTTAESVIRDHSSEMLQKVKKTVAANAPELIGEINKPEFGAALREEYAAKMMNELDDQRKLVETDAAGYGDKYDSKLRFLNEKFVAAFESGNREKAIKAWEERTSALAESLGIQYKRGSFEESVPSNMKFLTKSEANNIAQKINGMLAVKADNGNEVLDYIQFMNGIFSGRADMTSSSVRDQLIEAGVPKEMRLLMETPAGSNSGRKIISNFKNREAIESSFRTLDPKLLFGASLEEAVATNGSILAMSDAFSGPNNAPLRTAIQDAIKLEVKANFKGTNTLNADVDKAVKEIFSENFSLVPLKSGTTVAFSNMDLEASNLSPDMIAVAEELEKERVLNDENIIINVTPEYWAGINELIRIGRLENNHKAVNSYILSQKGFGFKRFAGNSVQIVDGEGKPYMFYNLSNKKDKETARPRTIDLEGIRRIKGLDVETNKRRSLWKRIKSAVK